jgi:hypothetical protein
MLKKIATAIKQLICRHYWFPNGREVGPGGIVIKQVCARCVSTRAIYEHGVKPIYSRGIPQ